MNNQNPNATPTIFVSVMDDQPALVMIWQHRIRIQDVAAAFHDLHARLDNAAQKMYVIVDIQDNPQFPMLETINEAMDVQRHTNLEGWLVIGSGTLGRLIAATLKNISRRENVRWFKDYNAVHAFLADQQMTA